MFTGIVQGLREVCLVERRGALMRLAFPAGDLFPGLIRGASVGVNGVCLTVADLREPDIVHADVIAETQRVTNLGSIRVGDKVNLERSARIGDEIGGHGVSGHVHGQALVLERRLTGDDLRLYLRCPEQLMRYVFHKGFVALDGASLTVSSLDRKENRFSVDLIPETRRRTTLGLREQGDGLNLEADLQMQALVDTVTGLFADADWIANLPVSFRQFQLPD